ncbi:MAG TPA: hypothetical protein VHD31_02205 [Candidatus Paceibacterota bacterium]|nr:hypothetical protein [Candidatus Paceibacterota bacterium]
MNKWLESAAHYVQHNENLGLKSGQVADVRKILDELIGFAKSAAYMDAIVLLECSNNAVQFGKLENKIRPLGNGEATYVLSSRGFGRIDGFINVVMGVPTPISPLEMAIAMVRLNVRPGEAVDWITRKLDDIAGISAPSGV